MRADRIYRPLENTSKSLTANSQSLEIIKWLRQNGERGKDWDFAGSGRSLNIWFHNTKIEMLYILRWQ